MTDDKRPCISIVVPACNEEGNLAPLHESLCRLFNGPLSAFSFELIIVDDGSTDGTAAEISSLSQRDPAVVGIHFARNFGQQAALVAGLEEARGDAVITMDADLEQPPQSIVDLVHRWQEGYQVVHGIRRDHRDTPLFKRWSSRWFYRVFRLLCRIPMEPGMLDFRLMDRQVVDAVLSMREADFFLRGITAWIGFSQARVPYEAGMRTIGRSKYSLPRMVSFAIRGITSFSTFPLRLATYLGALMTLFALGYGGHVLIARFFWEHPTPGFASITILLSLFMGIQFLLLGLLGEYVARIHVEVKDRPRYFIARREDRRERAAVASEDVAVLPRRTHRG